MIWVASLNQSNVINFEESQNDIDSCTKDCAMPCESWRYDTKISSLPNYDEYCFNAEEAYYEGNLDEKHMHCSKGLDDSSLNDTIDVQFAFINLEYKEFIEEGNLISWTDVMSNLGGHIGLW